MERSLAKKKLMYTEEMKVQDELWEKGEEDREEMERLFHQIVEEAKSKGFTGYVNIWESELGICAQVCEKEEHFELERLGLGYEPMFSKCQYLIQRLEKIMNKEFLKEEVKSDDFTVWRITAGDFREIINQHFPEWTEKEVNKVIERASRDFNIEGWEDIVYTFSYFYYQDIKKEEEKK